MPVFRFVRDLFGRKDATDRTEEVGLEDLPALLDQEEERVAARLEPACAAPMDDVRAGVAELEGVLDELRRADWDEAHHPKLEQISRTTLPAFIRAMDACLSRPLPDEPHEFYGAATGLLKCAINALRGQGRYLRAVLPEEMKATKVGIDRVGHAVNALTTAFGEERRDLDRLAAARALLARIEALRHEEADTARRANEAHEALDALQREREADRAGLERLNRSPEALALDGTLDELERARARAAAIAAAHRDEGRSLVQVFRRAERLSARRGERQAATRLHHLQGRLEETLPRDEAVLAPLLAEGLAQVRELVAAGEIAPSEEEPAARAEAFLARIAEHARAVAEVEALEQEVASSPVTADRERLTARLRQLEHREAALQDERAGLGRVAAQKVEERESVRASLDEAVTAAFGGRVRLQPPGA